MRSLPLILVTALALNLGVNSFVSAQIVRRSIEIFEKLDRNRDKLMSMDEYREGHAGKYLDKMKRFKSLDSDRDGFLTLQEFRRSGVEK